MSLHHEAMTGQVIIRPPGLRMTDQIIDLHLRMTGPDIAHRQGIMRKDRVLLLRKETMTPVEAMTGQAILLPKGTMIQAGAMTDQVIHPHKGVNPPLATGVPHHQAEIPDHLQVEAEAAVLHVRLLEVKRDFFQTKLVYQNKVSTSVLLLC